MERMTQQAFFDLNFSGLTLNEKADISVSSQTFKEKAGSDLTAVPSRKLHLYDDSHLTLLPEQLHYSAI